MIIGGELSRTRLLPGSGADEWTPFDLGDALLGFWDAEDSASLTLAGPNVAAWKDRKGSYAPSQATTASMPRYSATGFNGRPCVVFDGVDDYLELTPVPTTFPVGANPCEIWGLFDQTVPSSKAGGVAIIAYGAASADRRLQRSLVNTMNRGGAATATGISTLTALDGSVDFSGVHTLRGIFGSTITSISVDGRPPTSLAVIPGTASTRLRLGAIAAINAAAYFTGTINALIVTTSLQPDQSARLSTFLRRRGNVG